MEKSPTIYLISGKVERVLFHSLSSRFVKENQFWGGSCDETHVTIGPKGALGSQKHVEEVSEVYQENWWFPKKNSERKKRIILFLEKNSKTFSHQSNKWSISGSRGSYDVERLPSQPDHCQLNQFLGDKEVRFSLPSISMLALVCPLTAYLCNLNI